MWRDFWRWSLKFRIRYPNTGARVGVRITFSPPVCLCRPTLEECGAYAIHQHRGVVKHVAMANTTPLQDEALEDASSATKKTAHIVDCVMGLSRLPCRKQSLPAKTLGWIRCRRVRRYPNPTPTIPRMPPPMTDATVAVEGTSGVRDADVTDVAAARSTCHETCRRGSSLSLPLSALEYRSGAPRE